MKYRIHYSVLNDGYDDYVDLEGPDYGSIAEQARSFLASRGLTADSSDAWSELIKE